ncbi:hypothetical protein L228DRAFT_238226 [Xylona heveae TC161]|uniref:Uncharacterized protein n=1 Tax=Xylona heveae (strain CBS 132557 / TC161) TaxID=1328760 RepID=A0A165HLH9_XYLHT|nr:hypothetical protein L228DRAFT_238226 [Xylona heveae TC161]KZF23695.1 hypothetical protein L228DRAFT_238226 [Xylona heveae TC161]
MPTRVPEYQRSAGYRYCTAHSVNYTGACRFKLRGSGIQLRCWMLDIGHWMSSYNLLRRQSTKRYMIIMDLTRRFNTRTPNLLYLIQWGFVWGVSYYICCYVASLLCRINQRTYAAISSRPAVKRTGTTDYGLRTMDHRTWTINQRHRDVGTQGLKYKASESVIKKGTEKESGYAWTHRISDVDTDTDTDGQETKFSDSVTL